jgi:hypothetical protein
MRTTDVPCGREYRGAIRKSDRSDRVDAPDWSAALGLSGGIKGRSLGRRRPVRPIVTKTSLQWEDSAAIQEGTRMQFVAFDTPYLERLQSGDAETEQHFAAYFGELIQLKLRARLSSKEAVEDVTQETFVRVLALVRAKDGVKQPERLGALVNSVCNHVLFEHYRSRRGMDSSLDEET